jgi:urease accessory protein
MSTVMLADLRLYQLISPSLPIGAFTYSQGLEWAIEAKWVDDEASLEAWLISVMQHSLATLELPILVRVMNSLAKQDDTGLYWVERLLASRETKELRKEEKQRGAALAALLPKLDIQIPELWREAIPSTQVAGFALAANQFAIDPTSACSGYAWSWLENAVMAGVKLVPLGQTSGQQLLLRLSGSIPELIERAMTIEDMDICSSTPALAIASSRHETQYTRLFRS